MSRFDKLIAAHPLRGNPYDKLEFVRFDGNGTPLYRVEGVGGAARGAATALGKAFELYGGKCFYCPTKFSPQRLSNDNSTAHRDHVIATSQGGTTLLHNLVIACGRCGRTKADDPVHEFRPKSAKEYLEALNRHIAACLGQDRKP
jgi:5-methylcytosine-specific restriction endonuclease McrA